jgi:hypothetical protein
MPPVAPVPRKAMRWPRLRAVSAGIVAAAWLVGPALAAAAAPAPEPQSPSAHLDSADAVAKAVLVANPELTALEERIQALEHAVPQAGVWPDPMAAVDAEAAQAAVEISTLASTPEGRRSRGEDHDQASR